MSETLVKREVKTGGGRRVADDGKWTVSYMRHVTGDGGLAFHAYFTGLFAHILPGCSRILYRVVHAISPGFSRIFYRVIRTYFTGSFTHILSVPVFNGLHS